MATYKGCEGKIVLNDGSGAETVGEVTSIEITESANNNTFKTFGSCDDRTENLGKGYTVSIEGRYCNTDAGQVQIAVGDVIGWEYYPGGDVIALPPEYSGNFRVDELTISASADETVTFSVSATGDGALARANTY
jgi:hypothetical protein